MSEIRHLLNKSETERMNNLLAVARMQEELLDSLTLSYKVFLLETVFKRLGLKNELFAKCVVDLSRGELIIREEQKPPVEKPPVEAKPIPVETKK